MHLFATVGQLTPEKELRLNKVAMKFEDCFRDPGLN